jgi:hypothetical protein
MKLSKKTSVVIGLQSKEGLDLPRSPSPITAAGDTFFRPPQSTLKRLVLVQRILSTDLCEQ